MVRLALVGGAALLPALCVLLHRTLIGADGFRLGAFVLPACLEATIVALVWRYEHSGRLSPARSRLLLYLTHTVVGLPATVYLSVGAPVPETALFRQLAILLLLVERRAAWASLLQHETLLGAGIFALGFRDYRSPTEGIVWLRLAEQCVVFGLAVTAGIALASARRRWFVLSMQALRTRRAQARASEILDGLVRRIAPDAPARFLAGGSSPPVEVGWYLCLTVDCAEAHRAHDFFKTHSGVSQRAGIEDFLGEWQKFVAYAAQLGRAGGLEALQGTTFLRQVKRIAGQDMVQGSEALRFHLVQGLVVATEIARFSDRSKRALQARGQEGWHTACSVEIMEASTAAPAADPVWALRGSAVAAAEQFLSRVREAALVPRVWMLESQFPLVSSVFEPTDILSFEGRLAGGLLRAEYSLDGAGTTFAGDVWDRLRYDRVDESD